MSILFKHNFDSIPLQRRVILENIEDYIKSNNITNIIFICTHNSRRSQMCEVWSREALAFYGVSDKYSFFSGGMEVTEFNPNAVKALTSLGVKLVKGEGENPIYEHYIGNNINKCYSKLYDDEYNPKNDFIAIMTCSDADENCPNVMGAKAKFSLTFEDPKVFDNRENAVEYYIYTSNHIANEIYYIFSKL